MMERSMQSAFPAFWLFREGGKWTWKFAAVEGDFIASSDKTYASRHECLQAVKLMTATTNVAVFSTLDDLETVDSPAPAAGAARSGEAELEPLELKASQRLQDDATTPRPGLREPFIAAPEPRAQMLSSRKLSAEADRNGRASKPSIES